MSDLARRTTDIANSDVFTKTALILPDDITEEETVDVGKYLSKAESGIAWWTGDLGLTRENKKYGSGIDFAEEIGVDHHYLDNCMYVSRQYEPSYRYEGLTHTHHLAAAPLADRDDLLQWAIAEKASVSKLRAEIKRRNTAAAPQIEPDREYSLPDGVSVILGDAIEELKKLPSGSIDLVATDPPYNMDKADWDSYGSGEEFAAWCEQWMIECQRVLKPHGSIYIFGINRMLSHLQRWLDENMVYRNWIMWDTIQGAGGGLWTNRHEAILYYSKSEETYEDKDSIKLERHEEHVREYKGKEYKFKNPSNIWRFPCVDNKHEDRTGHITQKPVEIMQRIIKANCPDEGIVCDPFTGSGTSAVAAVREDRKFIGFEIDDAHHAIAMKRIADEISS